MKQMELTTADNTHEVAFHLSEQEYEHVKKGSDELLVAGKMYDVKSLVRDKGAVYVMAICDEDEDNIISKIKKILGQNRNDKKPPAALIELLSLEYIVVSEQQLYRFSATLNENYGVSPIALFPFYMAVTSPPPWVI